MPITAKRNLSKRGDIWLLLWMFLVFVGIVGLARSSSLTFPYPWNDEARFFLPSWIFAQHGSLAPDIVNAPQGIFWTPHGFYIFLGSILGIFGNSIEVARAASQVLVASAACVLIATHRSVAGSALCAGFSGLLLLSPPSILSANAVRMECVVIVFYALSLFFLEKGRPLISLALLLLSLLVHPALMIALLLFSGTLLARKMLQVNFHLRARPGGTATIAEFVFLVLVIGALVLECAFVLRHLLLFRAHMAYQSARKMHHDFGGLLLKPQGLVLLLACAVTALLLWRRLMKSPATSCFWALIQVASIALGLQLYAVLGGEFAYDIYSLCFVPATFFCIAYRLAGEDRGIPVLASS